MNEVVALLRQAQRVTAICHENPDADTLGAAIAIAIAAERLGKASEVVSADPPPPLLAFVPRIGTARRAPALEPDVAVVVDAGDLTRIGSVATEHADWLARARVANVDHHISNTGFGTAVWVDPTAAATCEMVALLLPELGVEIDQELATVLMTGIAQDTHTFAHPNATPRTLRVAAELLEAGAPLSQINRTLYVDKPYSTLALWGLMLAGIGQRCDGRIVYASMTNAMLAEVGEEPSAGEGFVDLLGSTKAADITVLFKEADETTTRVSVRTSDRADAVAITSAFGGGGHARAAGCTVVAPLAAAREQVLAECERELARVDAGSR
jgi:phosphoesterase RecJ-like protein